MEFAGESLVFGLIAGFADLKTPFCQFGGRI